jgi:Secretion system C-terminal sorting domain
MRFIKLLLLSLFIFSGYNKKISAQYGAMPPFTVQVEAIGATTIPGMHSLAFAQSGDKWLFIGGRTNGLHGINSSGSFPPEYINNTVTVIDTATWTSYSADLNQLPQAIAGPMRSTNMEFIHDGNYLYMVGGYGYDSILNRFVTFPTLTAVHVNDMITAVINALPIASAVRQVVDTNLRVCGGDLDKIGSKYYLIFGHNFEGRYTDPPTPLYTQTYSNQITKFNLTDDGTTISLSGYTYDVDTNNYHRRDLNVGAIVQPSGALALEAYGGVFQKNADQPFREPIKITATGATVNMGYQQVMSHYTSALLPIYDSATQTMYTTFFGGISLYDYNHTTNLVTLDTLIPFIDDITTLTEHASGMMEETVLPTMLPDRLGSNALFVPNLAIPHYANEVINIRSMPNTKAMVGYLVGGIRAQAANLGITIANDTVYRIYITPNNNVGIDETVRSIQNSQLYPNPANASSTLSFYLKEASAVTVNILDITGKEIMEVANEKMLAGNQSISINTSKLNAGIYICKIKSEGDERLLKLVIGK